MSAATPVSASTPYITPTDLLNWRDWRQMADWLSINDTRGTESAFTSSTVAAEHCNAAGGLLEAACLKGHRYEVADLQALIAAAPNQSQSLLKRIVSFVAIDSMSRFKKRTPADESDIEWAFGMLESLSNGDRIFSFLETQNAGVVGNTRFLHHHRDRPSRQAEPLFGLRGNRGSWDRWGGWW